MKYLNKIFSLALALSVMASCLPLQTNEPYTGESLDPYEGVNCWDFLQLHKDELGCYIEAIQLCGIKDYFTQTTTQYTFLPLTDKAIKDDLDAAKADATKVPALKDILLFHIIKGSYHGYGTLRYDVVHVETLLGGDAKMSICISSDGNQYERDRVKLMTDCGSSTVVYSIACNHICTNGPAHLLDTKCVYVD